MAEIPQTQIANAYRQCLYLPKKWVEFGRAYRMYYDGKNGWKLIHYGTTIYEGNSLTKKFKVGGWSKSDVDAINSLAYYLDTGGAYIQNGKLYAEGTGPRYKKKTAKPKTNKFGLAKM